MRKKLTLLFALLCASVMGFAIDWSGIDWLPGSNSTYKVVVSPAGPNIMQEQDWAGKRCIYVTYDGANFGDCSLDPSLFDTQGAGKFYYTSAFLQQETEFTQVHNGTTYTFTVYNDKPVTVPSTKAPTPIVPASRVKGVYSEYEFNTGYSFANWCGTVKQSSALVQGRSIPFYQMGNNCFGMEYGHFDVSNMTQIHLDIWTENTFDIRFYLISPGHETYYTINLTGGVWNTVDIPLSTYTAASVDLNDVFQFKFDYPSEANQTIFVDNIYFYAESDVDPDPTDIEDTNFALQSKGAIAYGSSVTGANYPARAIDGDNNTIWESIYDTDPQILAVDLGRRRNLNLVKILWGNQWSSEFYIETSNNATDWTEAKHVTGNTDNYSHQEQSFDLNSKVTARYIRFRGIHRGNGWGYTIKTFTAMLSGVPVLTSVDLSSDKNIAKVGTYATLTASPKDQNSSAIAATLSYEVSPADAGHVTDGKYYPEKFGLATITVTAEAGGVQVTNNVQIWGVTSDNLAWNKTSEAGYNPSNQGEINTKANDGDESTLWVTWENASVADEWWYVDLGTSYDITGINVSWGGDYSTNYILQVRAEAPSPDDKANDEAWTTLATVTTASANSSVFSQVTGTGRYVRFHSLSRSWWQCFRLRELQVFGSESSTPTKSVSVAVNDPLMGTATVKQNGDPVTEVETGSTVTFSAVANDGYIFVDWSNGNTNATFNATVDAAMNLTANFRALGTTYCNTLVHSSNSGQEHDAYVTMKRSGENEYQLIVRTTEALSNFGGTNFYKPNNVHVINIRDQGVLSNNNHTLTVTFSCDKEPYMTDPLYVVLQGGFEAQFPQLTNIEYSQPCADPEITAIELNKTEATLEMGNTLTLVPTFTPAYMSADITWQTSDADVATVDNGVVTANAIGTATITAETSNGKTATCAVTVEPITEKTWWGTQTITEWDPDMDVMWSVTRNANKTLTYTVYFGGDASDKVKQINNGEWHGLVGYDDVNRVASYTTETTYEKGTKIKPDHFFYFGGPRIELADVYVVGSENERPSTAVESVEISSTAASLLPEENLQLTATVLPSFVENKNVNWSSDNKSVATVSNTGYVTAVAEGTAHITATSVADGTKSATCTVTVVGSITSATWYGYSTVSPLEGLTAYTYSITRGTDHKLTFTMTTDKNVVGYVSGIEGDVTGAFGGYDAVNHTGTFTTAGTYTDGAELHLRLTFASASYGAPAYNFSYTVGSSNAALPQAVAVDEEKDNTAILTTYDGQTVIGVLGRSFTAGNLYTLVLPFDVDAAQTAAKLPGHLTKLQNTIVKENQDLRINFVDVSAIEAGVPYLYEPSAAVANPTFESVEVSATLNPTVADSYAKYYGIYAPMDGDALHAKDNAYVLGPDQYLYAVSDLPANQTMLALRAYFVLHFPPSAGAAPRRVAQVVFNSQETEVATGIENTIDNEQNAKILRDGQLLIIREGKMYNAQGQLIK